MIEAGFSFLIQTAVDATVILLAGFLCLLAMRRSNANARRLLCAFKLGALILLPLVSVAFALSPIEINFPVIAQSESIPRAGAAALSIQPFSLTRAGLLFWLAGFLFCFGRAAVGEWYLRKQLRRANPSRCNAWFDDLEGLAGRNKIALKMGQVNSPLTCGLRRPVILLPETAYEWSGLERRAVLLHEFAHIRQKDCLMQYISLLACALFWFHPLVWAMAAALRAEQEYACDDAVLQAGVEPTSYAGLLLENVRALPSGFLFACPMSGKNPRRQLRNRFAHLLDSQRDHGMNSRFARYCAIFLGLLLISLGTLNNASAREKIYKPGDDVSMPVVLYKVEPAYTQKAKQAKIQGTVLLSVVIGTDGLAHNVAVMRSLDPGLDDKAIQAVEQWQFKPGEHNGEPVPVEANVEMNFRLK